MNTGFHFGGGMEFFIIDMQEAPVILLLLAAAIVLEIFLARKEDWRIGALLPAALFAWRLIQLAGRLVCWRPRMDELFLALAVENIPTLLLMAVYGLCRLGKRWRTRQQLEKTRIEDL